jgi:nucleotide-binding universal stress UspA family protein
VKRGDVVEEIIATANEEENDLIILTAHASAPEESYVSKTIRDIIRLSRVPVTIVPATDILKM